MCESSGCVGDTCMKVAEQECVKQYNTAALSQLRPNMEVLLHKGSVCVCVCVCAVSYTHLRAHETA